jgi:hypothetical protein
VIALDADPRLGVVEDRCEVLRVDAQI